MLKSISRAPSALAAAGALFVLAGPCAAGIIGFNANSHGQIIDEDFAGMGVHFSAVNLRGGPDLAIVFDTNINGTADPDLENPWLVGNMWSSSNQAGILIIAENATDANGDGRVDSPDDQAAPIGSSSGEIRIAFDYDLSSFGFDLFDCEGGAEVNSSVGFVAFRDNGVEKARVSFNDFINPSSAHYDATIVYGDRSANHIKPLTAQLMGIQQFDEVRINVASGGIDTITWGEAAPVPEPAAATVMLLGATALAARRRRR